ncbi:MAG: hypothetical protein V2I38_13985 [Alcanivoracaceae bacterium]|nr:hypothetical protein [Alcanivoracaceae bacterium]
MTKTIVKFSAHKTALTFACVMALSSIVFLVPMSLVFFNAPMHDANGNPVNPAPFGIMLVVMPILYLIMGYIMTIIGAWIYNFVSRFTGGIQFELTDSPDP